MQNMLSTAEVKSEVLKLYGTSDLTDRQEVTLDSQGQAPPTGLDVKQGGPAGISTPRQFYPHI